MYVCLCNGITEREVREAAESGITSMRELGRETGVGQQCGRCACMAKGILREYHAPLGLNLDLDLLRTLAYPA